MGFSSHITEQTAPISAIPDSRLKPMAIPAMRICVTVPAPVGHLNAMTALARRLQTRGHEVICIGVPDASELAGCPRVCGMRSTVGSKFPLGVVYAERATDAEHAERRRGRRLHASVDQDGDAGRELAEARAVLDAARAGWTGG